MPPSTTKKVVLYRWDRQPAEGFVGPPNYLSHDHIEWMTSDGRLELCPFDDCKALCFVSEPGKTDLFTDHPLFERRPRVAGLWTRFSFRDGDRLDGVLAHNLLDWPVTGYLIVPPQAGPARQKVFLPRVALLGTELRGVVGGPGLAAVRRDERANRPTGRQLTFFDG